MALKIIQTDMPFPVMSMEADKDYLLARMIAFTGGGFHARAGYLAQMACEKYLKALTIQNEKMYAEIHALLPLAEMCEKYDPYFGETDTKRVLEQFDMYDQVGRYGGAAKYDPLSNGKAVGGVTVIKSAGMEIAGATVWLPRYLDDLDGFVFRARALLDHQKIKWGDGLKDILGEGKGPLVGLWKFPIALKDILTHENRYFKA